MSLDNLQDKLKIQIKLCINRLRLIQQKMSAIHKQQEKELIVLSEKNMKQNLMIKAEKMIREDMKVELLGILDLYCEMLLSRFYLLKKGCCHEQIEQAVCTLVYAAPRCEIKELHNMSEIFRLYFGREFIHNSIENKHGKVDLKVVEKLSNELLNNDSVECYLQEILRPYNMKQNDYLNTYDSICNTIVSNEKLEGLSKIDDSNLASMISSFIPDNLESQLKPSIYSHDCNEKNASNSANSFEIFPKMSKDTSNNTLNMDQLRARFERLKQN
ncbi:hypothetical protein PCANB_002092 [Pneumocystis canis]|nr:hypothetical protein PCANB_002092 [Pneumocystis canis]